MFYRLSCILQDGTIRGYQWREVDQATFVAIATGQRPVGDADAQSRDSTQWDTEAQNRTIYYGHVHKPDHGWITDLSTAEAEALYLTAGYEQAGA